MLTGAAIRGLGAAVEAGGVVVVDEPAPVSLGEDAQPPRTTASTSVSKGARFRMISEVWVEGKGDVGFDA